MGWAQVTWVALAAVGVAIAGVKHGESKGNWSFWGSILNVSLYSSLLYAGGFFN
jgi:hypothetical protein